MFIIKRMGIKCHLAFWKASHILVIYRSIYTTQTLFWKIIKFVDRHLHYWKNYIKKCWSLLILIFGWVVHAYIYMRDLSLLCMRSHRSEEIHVTKNQNHSPMSRERAFTLQKSMTFLLRLKKKHSRGGFFFLGFCAVFAGSCLATEEDLPKAPR